MLIGSFRDFALIPISLVAALIDVVFKGKREGDLFYKVLRWSWHSEEMIDVYSPIKHETDQLKINPNYTVDAVIARLEGVVVREYEKGGTAASIKAALDKLGPEPAAPLLPLFTCQEPTFEGLCRALEFGQPSLGIFATEGPKLRHGYVPRQFDHAFDWRTVDFDGPDVSSFASFGRSLDLFGDGSVRLLYTPGHTLGHMSVALRVRDGEFLIAADSIYTTRTLRESVMPYGAQDEHEFRRSLREVQRYTEQTPGAVIVPGHDLEAFRALAPVY